MKFVYVLVSDNSDYFYEECYISVLSLRKHNKNAEIIVFVDDVTNESLVGFRGEIRRIADVKEVFFDKNVDKKQRSRLLKTTLRKMITGRFVYIDTDTVISDSLESLEYIKLDIGMVLDKHTLLQDNYCARKYQYYANIIKGEAGVDNKHFNGGFMVVDDSEVAHKFFELWEQGYKECVKKGISIDQTSLNNTNAKMGGVITELDGSWNVQLDCGLKYIYDAKILHYTGYQPLNLQNRYFNSLPFELCNSSFFDRIKQEESIIDEVLEVIDNPKKSFKITYMVPNDCVAYHLLFSNHFRILKYLFVKKKGLFLSFERIYAYIFRKMFNRV